MFVLALLMVVTLSLATSRVLSATTRWGTGRLLLVGLLMPISTVLLASLTLIAIPWCVGYVRLVIQSFG